MFVVRDWTRNPSYTMVSNDVKDVPILLSALPEMKRLATMCFFILGI